jgi:hypothetical protein
MSDILNMIASIQQTNREISAGREKLAGLELPPPTTGRDQDMDPASTLEQAMHTHLLCASTLLHELAVAQAECRRDYRSARSGSQSTVIDGQATNTLDQGE